MLFMVRANNTKTATCKWLELRKSPIISSHIEIDISENIKYKKKKNCLISFKKTIFARQYKKIIKICELQPYFYKHCTKNEIF